MQPLLVRNTSLKLTEMCAFNEVEINSETLSRPSKAVLWLLLNGSDVQGLFKISNKYIEER